MLPAKVLAGFHHLPFIWDWSFVLSGGGASLTKTFNWFQDSVFVVDDILIATDNTNAAAYNQQSPSVNIQFSMRRERDSYQYFNATFPATSTLLQVGMLSAAPGSGLYGLPVPIILDSNESLRVTVSATDSTLPACRTSFSLSGTRVFV